MKEKLASKIEEIDAKATAMFPLGEPETGEHREEVFVRVGKFGPYLEQGERRAPIPDGLPPDELNLEKAIELLDQGQVEEAPMGMHPDTGKPVYMRVGRFGPYIQMGEKDDPEKKNQGLLKGMTPEEVDFDLALKLLTLPRNLGEYPETKEPIEAFDGKFGPYVKSGKESRSLPEGKSPLDVTFDEAVALLKQPKTRGKRAPKEPLRVYEKPSPETEKEVRILDGFYGAYVTDGETNASLRKGMDPKELTFEAALDLLAERKAKGPTKKKKKKSTKKKATKKKATKKKATKKKGVVKKKA